MDYEKMWKELKEEIEGSITIYEEMHGENHPDTADLRHIKASMDKKEKKYLEE